MFARTNSMGLYGMESYMVEVEAEQIAARTDRMEVWFKQVDPPAAPAVPAEPPPAPEGPAEAAPPAQ